MTEVEGRMETKFTPGPWCVADSYETNPHHSGVRAREILVLAEDTAEPSICHVASVTPERSDIQARELANARLIAAAPDLYEALVLAERALKRLPGKTPNLGVALVATARALSRARGSS